MSCSAQGAGIRAINLGWGPRSNLYLVRGVTFDLTAGDRLAIVGPNGAGKTSLLRCLYRSVAPLEGTVEIGGENLWSMPSREAARRIAVVLQEMPADFPFSVRDVVMMGRIPRRQGLSGWNERDRSQVGHAIEHLDLKKLAARQFSTLSGGEKQRVLVARALAQEPEVIILDEPTNHLDIRHQLEILDLLKGLRLTVVTTLHDINLAGDFATHVGLMNGGRMVGFGAPDDVLTPNAVSSIFGVSAVSHAVPGFAASRFSFALSAS